MFSKRLIAKLIDVLLYVIVGGALIISFGILIDTIFALDVVTRLEEMKNALISAGDNVDMVNEILFSNMQLIYGTIVYSSIMALLIAIIYFGIAGKLLGGSFGKKIMKLHIKAKNDTILSYIKREPVIHLSVISLFIILLSLVFPRVIILDVFNLVFLLLFALGKDYWNLFANAVVDKNENIR